MKANAGSPRGGLFGNRLSYVGKMAHKLTEQLYDSGSSDSSEEEEEDSGEEEEGDHSVLENAESSDLLPEVPLAIDQVAARQAEAKDSSTAFLDAPPPPSLAKEDPAASFLDQQPSPYATTAAQSRIQGRNYWRNPRRWRPWWLELQQPQVKKHPPH